MQETLLRRSPGRPKLPKELHKRKIFSHLRIETVEALEMLSRKYHISRSEVVRSIIEDWFADPKFLVEMKEL